MNADDDSFEKLLKEQTIRQIPSDWRETIVPSALPKRRLWRQAYGWRALAACWVAILGLQWTTPSHPGSPMVRSVPTSTSAYQQANFQLALAVIQTKTDSSK